MPRVLASSRLLSLTGAGGVGKTRLAVRLASDLVNEFPDGVWLVDLAPLSVPDLVAQTIATALGVREGPQRSARDALLDTLRDRELLLVLDNCEHLIAACAELVEALLREAPALRILATSREALGVSGETVCRVPSLSLPEALGIGLRSTRSSTPRPRSSSSSARAPLTRPSHRPRTTRTQSPASAGVSMGFRSPSSWRPPASSSCHRSRSRRGCRTDSACSPAARERRSRGSGRSRRPWTGVTSCCRMSNGSCSAGCRCSRPRGRSRPPSTCVEATASTSTTCSICCRGWSASPSWSLTATFAGERRYRFLETVRQYARERLVQAGAADRLRERHFEFFFNEFRGALPILRHHDQLACLRRLRIEQENVRAALEWALTSPALAEKGVELAGALFWFWTKRGLFEEGKLWLERALAVAVTRRDGCGRGR